MRPPKPFKSSFSYLKGIPSSMAQIYSKDLENGGGEGIALAVFWTLLGLLALGLFTVAVIASRGFILMPIPAAMIVVDGMRLWGNHIRWNEYRQWSGENVE